MFQDAFKLEFIGEINFVPALEYCAAWYVEVYKGII